MNQANKKGDELEDAVATLESIILHDAPSLSDKNFVIDKRKILIIDSVKHEIDVYVKIDVGSGYESVFIFECKNWEDKVGKNEIIIFSEKIKSIGAQKGYFIAKSFTKYAKAQAKLDPRLSLLIANKENEIYEHIPDVHGVVKNISQIFFTSFERGLENSSKTIDWDLKSLVFIIDSVERDIQEYVNELSNKLIDEELNNLPTHTFPEGVYDYEIEKELFFKERTVLMNDKNISKIRINISFNIEVIRPSVLSVFSIENRGRVCKRMPMAFPGGDVLVSHIAKIEHV